MHLFQVQLWRPDNHSRATNELKFSEFAQNSDFFELESAKAVTGRQCPHSGEGEDFLARRSSYFYENGHYSGTKS